MDQMEFPGIVRDVAPDAPAPEIGGEVKGSGVLKWEQGMQITAIFIGLKSINTQFGPGEIVELEQPGTGRRFFVGGKALLVSKLRNVGFGVDVVIRCVGKVATRNGQAFDFKVWARGVAVEPDGDIPF